MSNAKDLMKVALAAFVAENKAEKEGKVIPDHTTRNEVVSGVIRLTDICLAELVSEEKLKTGRTMQDDYFTV